MRVPAPTGVQVAVAGGVSIHQGCENIQRDFVEHGK